jgi:tetratricopeptide (TPR) repeat protein
VALSSCLYILLALFLLVSPPARSACPPDTLFVSRVNTAVEACIRQDWPRAMRIMNRLVEEAPWHPAPWFFRATVHSYRMTDEESFRWERPFLADLDSAQARISWLAAHADRRVPARTRRYLEGNVAAWRAYHAGRREQYPTALRQGLRASSTWEELLKDCPEWADLELGLGNLRFWTSVRLKRVDWLPFVEDRRVEGMRQVERARREGLYSPWLPAANLCWIYLEMGQPESTLSLCRQALERFPGSRLFLFPQVDALEALGRWKEADACCRSIETSLAADSWPQRVNKVLVLEKRSSLAAKSGDAAQAARLSRQALSLPLEPQERERLKEKLELLRRRAR